MDRIITIGREFGSGGREFGKRLAELLHVAYYDNEIITGIAKNTKLAEGYVNQIVENHIVSYYPITVGNSFYPMMDPQWMINNTIFAEQSKIITDMAKKSPCVIVGRCSDYVLKDFSPFNIFIYADMPSKIERCRKKAHEGEPLTDKARQQQIQSVDRGRVKYYQFFTGRKWGDRLNYDLCINTTKTEIKKVAAAVAHMLESE